MVQPDKLRPSRRRRAREIRGDRWTVTNKRSHRVMRTLVSMLALTAGLAGCANLPPMTYASTGTTPMLGSSAGISAISVDPLDAPPPAATPAPSATSPSDPLLLVPSQTDASLRVPLGTLGASGATKPAAKPPTPLAPRESAAKGAPPAVPNAAPPVQQAK